MHHISVPLYLYSSHLLLNISFGEWEKWNRTNTQINKTRLRPSNNSLQPKSSLRASSYRMMYPPY